MKIWLIVLLSTALAGCGASSVPSNSTSPIPSTIGSVVITARDSGETFKFSLATHASLRLSNLYVWQAPRISGTAIAFEPVQYIRDPGYTEWNIKVVAPGSAQISSSGSPNCRPGTPCPATSRPFEVAIVVTQ